MELLQNVSPLLRKCRIRWSLFCLWLPSHLELTLGAATAVLHPQGNLTLESSLPWQDRNGEMEGHWVLKLVIFSCGNKQLQCVSSLKATRIHFPLSFEDCGTSGPGHPQVSSWSRPRLRSSGYGDGLLSRQKAATCKDSGNAFQVPACVCHACSLSPPAGTCYGPSPKSGRSGGVAAGRGVRSP